jgi:hypothetical protein
MNMEELFESPKSIEPWDFGLDDPKNNLKTSFEIISDHNKEVVDKIDDSYITLYRLRKPRRYALIDHSNTNRPRLLYIMYYVEKYHNFIGHKFATQIAVWRNSAALASEGVAKRIFFDELLREFNVVATDACQTPDGARFWDIRIAEALSKKLFVYYVNLLPERTFIQITSEVEYEDLKNDHEIWGNEQKHKQRKIIISSTKLD